MEPIKMRTRMLNAMTNHEVEVYLERNDIVFIPVGVNEMHGVCPLDVEYVMVEAYARLFAEQVDGLVLPNLIYFAPGGTQTGVGTINVSPVAGLDYLLEIMHSLLNQGFKRIVLLPAHGPTKGFLYTAVQQFFEETHVTPLFLSPHKLFAAHGAKRPDMASGLANLDPITKDGKLGCNTRILGAYKICKRLDDCPTGEETDGDPGIRAPGMTVDAENPDFKTLVELMDVHLPAMQLYKNPVSHGSGPMPWTRAELEKEAEIGERALREEVAACDFNRHMEAMKINQDYIDNVVKPVLGQHLRGNKYCK